MPSPAFLPTVSPSATPRRRRIPVCAAAPPSPASSIFGFAASRGYTLYNNNFGPFLNLQLANANEESLGTITGAFLPNRLHIESYKARARDPAGGLLAVSPGMLLFIAALAFASERGIPHVYGLAIDDAPEQHRRLVRYLVRFGGVRVMRVSDEIRFVPARLFYGGFGTVIRGDVESMLTRGLAMLERTTKPS